MSCQISFRWPVESLKALNPIIAIFIACKFHVSIIIQVLSLPKKTKNASIPNGPKYHYKNHSGFGVLNDFIESVSWSIFAKYLDRPRNTCNFFSAEKWMHHNSYARVPMHFYPKTFLPLFWRQNQSLTGPLKIIDLHQFASLFLPLWYCLWEA